MNKQELQGAFSKIHASQQLFQEVCMMKNRKNVKYKRKIVKAALIAAIIVAFAATTSLAAPMIYRIRINGRAGIGEMRRTPTGMEGTKLVQSSDIYVDMEMNRDAPTSIEQFYLPKLDSTYRQHFGSVGTDKVMACYKWAAWTTWTEHTEREEDEVCFYQYAGGNYDPETVYCSAVTELGGKPEAKLVQLADIQGYLVEEADKFGTRHFLWSDGDYLFHLEVPDEYTDADLEKVLHSITAVENILPYCVSMTPEDVESVFE